MNILPRRWHLPFAYFLLAVKERRIRPIVRSIKRASRRVRGKHKPNYIRRRREALGRALAEKFDNTVRYGPFKGLRLSPGSWWGTDTAGMLLGLYEQEVLTSLQSVPRTYRTFVELGAANGYYGVGTTAAGIFDRAYCFERSLAGRRVIKANAALNGVSDKVHVLGTASRHFMDLVPPEQRKGCVLLVDIEGGEFDLLDEAMLASLAGSIVLVELHEWFFPDGEGRLARLEAAARRHFRISRLTTAARDVSVFPELDRFNDDDRWLVCSEGRGRRMTWLRLDPLA
jgi:hypothetical protein